MYLEYVVLIFLYLWNYLKLQLARIQEYSRTGYPSPRSTLTLTSHFGQNCDLGEGSVISYPGTSIDQSNPEPREAKMTRQCHCRREKIKQVSCA